MWTVLIIKLEKEAISLPGIRPFANPTKTMMGPNRNQVKNEKGLELRRINIHSVVGRKVAHLTVLDAIGISHSKVFSISALISGEVSCK